MPCFCRWLTPNQVDKLQPGFAANCYPTQVIYPLPRGWTVQDGVVVMPAAAAATCSAAGSTAAAASGAAAAGSAGGGLRGGAHDRAFIAVGSLDHEELLHALCDPEKHPVTWRDLDTHVWCEVGGAAAL